MGLLIAVLIASLTQPGDHSCAHVQVWIGATRDFGDFVSGAGLTATALGAYDQHVDSRARNLGCHPAGLAVPISHSAICRESRRATRDSHRPQLW